MDATFFLCCAMHVTRKFPLIYVPIMYLIKKKTIRTPSNTFLSAPNKNPASIMNIYMIVCINTTTMQLSLFQVGQRSLSPFLRYEAFVSARS